MMGKLRTLRDFQMEQLANREAAINYLQVTLEEYQVDGDMPFFLHEIQTVIEAQGGISELAKQTGIEPQVLSEMLAGENAPRIDIFNKILRGLGCCLSIQPLDPTESNTELAAAETSIVASEISTPSAEVSVQKR